MSVFMIPSLLERLEGYLKLR